MYNNLYFLLGYIIASLFPSLLLLMLILDKLSRGRPRVVEDIYVVPYGRKTMDAKRARLNTELGSRVGHMCTCARDDPCDPSGVGAVTVPPPLNRYSSSNNNNCAVHMADRGWKVSNQADVLQGGEGYASEPVHQAAESGASTRGW